MSAPLRLIFAGTPMFAVPALEALLAAGHDIVAVMTQPDRPAGRGRKPQPSPVKRCAANVSLPVMQPQSLTDAAVLRRLRSLAPDLMVVAAYGVILPHSVLALPRLGCVNIHASLLPRWRGAAPVQRAILAGDAETGVTLMRMAEGLDTGPMIARRTVHIAGEDTGGALHDRLARAGADLLVEALPAYAAGELEPCPQPARGAVYARKLSKHEATIDWCESAAAIERRIRAFDPWPVARTQHRGTQLRLWRAQAETGSACGPPGRIEAVGKAIDVAAGDGILRLLELQAPGRRRQTAADFLNGYRLAPGDVLGRQRAQ